MSSQDEPTNQNDNEYTDRVVVDVVHSRFRSIQVHCDICNMDIDGNHISINKHFHSSHPSKEHCVYCKGKVFFYMQMPTDDSTEQPKKVIYHKCNQS
ncbi:transcription elongation factor subunit spt4 isoform X2 [Ptiloglossa arizonensis]|uniref:transcription elongation factor subunit spt4 isoform X2 n=1 Tax=Ptiloglossa arizonensis TaxID=3350558 RepID=UPI003FA13AE9